MTKKPSAIFFDAVGTLLKPATPVDETYHRYGNKHGSCISKDSIRNLFYESFKKEELKDVSLDCKTNEAREYERWELIVSECFPDLKNTSPLFNDLFNYYSNPSAWELYPGTIPVLKHLENIGINWGIASNFDLRLQSIVKSKLELCNCKWLIISSLVGYKKPSNHFFEHLQTSSGISFDKILMVGDSPENDIHPAKELGMQTFEIKEGQSLEDLLQLLGR
jgi:putative hydrolase of the HAD superfamily